MADEGKPPSRPPPLKTRSLSRQYSTDPVWVEEMKHVIDTKNCGPITVYVQGDVSLQDKKAVFLTVHDLGCNHTSFHDFVEHPVMKDIKERSIFIHVDVPGQEDEASDLPEDFRYPSMQQIGEDLVQIVDTLSVKYVIGLGEGAGANVLTRFALAHPDRLLGMVLIHCTSTKAGIMEYFNDKFMNWKLNSIGHHPSAEQYLVFHRFGNTLEEQLDNEEMDPSTRENLIKDFQERLKNKINPKNLQRYVQCFLDRSDLSSSVQGLKMEVLLVTGAKASHNHTVHTMHSHMNKAKSSLIKLDDVGDVLLEAPERLCNSLLLFCKGLGVLTSVNLRTRTFSNSSGGAAGRNRSMSMEDYDRPNARRLSVTKS